VSTYSPEPLVLNLAQAAQLLGLTEQQIHARTRSRARRESNPIPAFKIGRCLCFRRSDSEHWVELQVVAGAL